MTDTTLDSPLSESALAQESERAHARIRHRRFLIIGLRLAVLVLVLGGWELAAQRKWIDPFFYSMPSMIWDQIVDWIDNGTSQGPLWTQVLVTLEETVLGFLIGAVSGVFCGILLGRNKLLADVFSLYIQIEIGRAHV